MTTPAPRYWNLYRRTPSGRDQKRQLNHATTCALCNQPLGTSRALYAAYTGHCASEFITAHPACADTHQKQLTQQLPNLTDRALRKATDLP